MKEALLYAVADGAVMAVVFNAAAIVLSLANPRYFLNDYPKSVQEVAPPMTRREKTVSTIFTLTVMTALIAYGVAAPAWRGEHGFWALLAAGYINWLLVNFSDFLILDLWFCQKYRDRITIPGTAGHPDYLLKNWLRTLAYKEHLLVTPLLIAPALALLQALIGLAVTGFGN